MAQMLGFHVRAAYALQGLAIGVALGALIWTRMKRVSPAVERSVVVLASLLVTPFILALRSADPRVPGRLVADAMDG